MKVLCIDTESLGLDVLLRAQAHGHQVMWWDRIGKEGKIPRAGEGMVPKIKEFEDLRKKWLGWADLIWLPQNNFYLDLLEPYRKMGYPIYGGNVEAAKWETDRTIGQKIMKECGMNIIPSVEFRDYDAAIAFVRKHPTFIVSKPNGEADKALSYVAGDTDDMIYMLRDRWSKNPKYVAHAREYGFIMEEKKTGCEMGIGGWFGPGGFSACIEENWEYKKLYAGDKGQNTGEQGTLMRFVKKSKLADIALFPLAKKLREVGYCGNIDVNGSIDEKGNFWPFEFTMREGWPAKHNQVALQEGDPVQWMLDLVNGKDTMQPRYDMVSISVVVSIPDYPYSRLTGKEVQGIPIYNAGDKEHIHFCEVMMGDNVPVKVGDKVVDMPHPVTAGDYVLVVTGTGETITGARRSAYTALDKIRIPNSPGWRIDIGRAKLVENLPMIQKHGYARGLSF